ncbi:META domain-containing protein [Gordonia pseudamarae]|jgi:heat shock protein HslJ|uniref:META domain-containing protein n=1 Tax=Gordonia pseudamarae TaxID=2831662 RepID=A0ABX6IK93_9ACTN|nr:META domain-containing protein [Gordonia pseudamarae]QHN26638.1 META domain-containing protein [Gordonia pseudamarae]QHN35531.1 META domain-containing protein [Gordonia pseudamarae]
MVHLTRSLGTLLATGFVVLGAAACGNSSTVTSSDSSTTQVVVHTATSNSLVGKRFTSTSVDGAAIPGDGPLVITFPEEGRVSLTAGCNQHIGTVTVDPTRLTFGTLASTQMACPPPRDGADAWLADFTDKPLTWSLDGPELTLKDGPRTVVLIEGTDAAGLP